MAKHVVGTVRDIPPGKRIIVEVKGRSIGIFNIGGKFYGLRNRCLHQGAPLCKGRLTGTMLPSRPGEYNWGREGEIIRCPWHGWEFDVTNGKSVFNPQRMRVKSYEITVEGGTGKEEEDPPVESYLVTVEEHNVILHL